jgi:hypothetical protein
MAIRPPTAEYTPDGPIFDFMPMFKEIQAEMAPESLRTLAKLVDVYTVSPDELAELRTDCSRIVTYKGRKEGTTWVDDRLSMQAVELLKIFLAGLPQAPEENTEQAPY